MMMPEEKNGVAAIGGLWVEEAESARNPLLEDAPADTLRNVECILSFLQDCAAAEDAPRRNISGSSYTGLACILSCATHALSTEIKRIHTLCRNINVNDKTNP